MKKKPKPATAGERLEMKTTGWTLSKVRAHDHVSRSALRIDAEIKRAVMKERRRCLEWARNIPSVGVPGIESGEWQ